MIVTKLLGGLGNQLFQYAAGRALSTRSSAELRLDLSAFEGYRLRSYKLSHFNVVASVLSESECATLGLSSTRVGPFGRLLQRIVGGGAVPVLRERRFEFNQEFLSAPRQCYLDGYWQSPRYFASVEPMIRTELTVRESLDGVNLQFAHEIRECLAVSLHVRRGDYISNRKTNRYHGTCGPEYYATAEGLLRERLGQLRVFVFSDDPGWAEANLRLGSPMTVVRHNSADRDYEDLRLMTLCRHHIIANSTFSWWGAWLCAHPGKVVVAPRNWFQDPAIDTSDLIPDGWIRV